MPILPGTQELSVQLDGGGIGVVEERDLVNANNTGLHLHVRSFPLLLPTM